MSVVVGGGIGTGVVVGVGGAGGLGGGCGGGGEVVGVVMGVVMLRVCTWIVFFFFQAEDGIRDLTVTGVQTCALPIFWKTKPTWRARHSVSLLRDMCVISSPATVMFPAEGTSSPPSRFSNVVLPEPDRKSVV